MSKEEIFGEQTQKKELLKKIFKLLKESKDNKSKGLFRNPFFHVIFSLLMSWTDVPFAG